MSAVTAPGPAARNHSASSRWADAAGRASRSVDRAVRRAARLVLRLPALALLGLLWVYQRVVSPWTPASCRYYPSCSQYAVIAVRRHGAVRGSWLAVRRLGRCHPWAAGGVDDVPPARETSALNGPRRARSSTR